MSPRDITNTEFIKFLVETYDKTAGIRMRWNEENKEKLKLSATFRGPEKGHTENTVARLLIETDMNSLAICHDLTTSNRMRKPYRDSITVPRIADLRKGHSIADVALEDPKDDPRLAKPDTDLSKDPVMRPVPPKQKQIIQDGIPFFGRKEYLKIRNRVKPEDKYYFQETSGWANGWRLKDSVFGKQAPVCEVLP
ncbi:hypothetical protein O0L34_g15668 [Tuta absoluta]|nr:hypothetical protein O0L34_g15668 [Tuta absoluta]